MKTLRQIYDMVSSLLAGIIAIAGIWYEENEQKF